ncbi:uncharacterized protein LOC121377213 [Gigantopelta aegis]|uniref:uncharacterized protein LOC121377213 n=1 Tax=Gigantopelta aegis TaxID=1735272 RepID=UPI001B88E6BD|nr:uncharacterized protein LOC121377213 [Gigantopelta aegis]
MGSGSSKSKTVTESRVQNSKAEHSRLPVANENNNNATTWPDAGRRQNNVIRNETDNSKTIFKSTQREDFQTNEVRTGKNNLADTNYDSERNKKSSKQATWESDADSILDDPWDEFLGPAKSSNAYQTNASRGMHEREREMNDINAQRKEESYPETYAQRLTREQYKLDQAKLLRQKTIYRDTDEWKMDEDAELEKKKSKGFDASKFREVNAAKHQENAISSAAQELQTPRYITDMDQSSHVTPKETTAVKKLELPTYSPEEEELMTMLEDQWPHQSMTSAAMY